MSTKASLTHGDGYHLYEEIFDQENIWLRLDAVEFEATHAGLTVGIPLPIWENIRQHSFAKCDLVGLSDRKLREMATLRVDDRLQQYKDASGILKRLMEAHGVKDPRPTQIRVLTRRLRQDQEFQESIAKKTGWTGNTPSSPKGGTHENEKE